MFDFRTRVLARCLLDIKAMREMVEQNRGKLVAGVAGGVIATVLMTALLFAAPAFTGAKLPEVVARTWATLVAHPWLALLALGLHFGYGALAGALYVAGARRINVVSGLFFGFALWGLAVAVYAPVLGLGFLAGHEPTMAALVLPAHLLYGAALGALVPRGEITQTISGAWRIGLGAAA
jgi:hypothetical protein